MGAVASVIAPLAVTALGALAGILTRNSGSVASAAPIDVDSIKKTAMDAKEQEHQKQREKEREEYEKQLRSARADSEALSKLRAEHQQAEKDRKAELAYYKERINDLTSNIKKTEAEMRSMKEQLEKPVRDLAAKMDFVNGLNLKIRQTDSLLLLGPKGTGKSTFLWLLKKGAKPTKTYSDGTAQLLHYNGFTDTIGLRGWTPEEVLKLFVLMIYDGIPKDLIIFGNDRVQQAFTALASWGVMVPMIAIMSGEFWKKVEPPQGGKVIITLTDTGRIRKITPESDLHEAYDLTAYKVIRDIKLGEPVTHHDDIDHLVRKRHAGGVLPFKVLMNAFRNQNQFLVTPENRSSVVDGLFRLIYVYEKKYARDRLKFMNEATLQDFS
ncbi:uncharacterized protein LOC129586038 [Paramacrobiotus metropolitanus]|uniref:uncharacterized protein LOC129586038 n=1 Tax=Paramacrobiotus metropolitanus TaxID=2943436 RepID=UPI002445C885|nr:uncharacterized protein LOC129586038 [Paramacrobiotus metropolitanus]